MNQNRTILITGTSSGIGRAIALKLLALDHQVIGIARDPAKAGITAANFHALSIDLADLEQLPHALKKIAADFPSIDTVICNAGYGQFASLEEFSYAQIRQLIDTNLTSTIYVIRALLPLLKTHQHENIHGDIYSDIIVIGSEAAIKGGQKGSIYAATKFALRGFIQSIREECASAAVRTSLINPGMVKTAFYDELSFGPGEDPQNYILPEDIADTVSMILAARPHTVFDEINLSPLKKVIRFIKKQ